MTGFDETVPLDPDPSADGTAVDTGTGREAGSSRDAVVRPEGAPEALEADGEDAPAPTDERPMGGDDDIAAGHLLE